jgi:hypothetical protein
MGEGYSMIADIEKSIVAIATSAFVFSGYLLESVSKFSAAYENVGAPALTPYLTVLFVTIMSTYYHHREKFTDHFRLIVSCMGLPAFIVGLQGLSRFGG